MTLRAFAAVLAAALSAALAVATPAHARDQLHLYNWNNYIAPETIKRFEDSCKCEVVQTYYSDNEELLAKLAAGAKGYDMYVPTSNAVQALIKSGRLKPIDKAAIPNLKNIVPPYEADDIRVPAEVISYALMINRNLVKPADEPKKRVELSQRAVRKPHPEPMARMLGLSLCGIEPERRGDLTNGRPQHHVLVGLGELHRARTHPPSSCRVSSSSRLPSGSRK